MYASDRNCEKGDCVGIREISSSIQTQPTLDDFNGDDDAITTVTALDTPADVFDISPINALKLLCMNVERLGQMTAEISEGSLAVIRSAASEQKQIPYSSGRQDPKQPRVTELICFRSVAQTGWRNHESIQHTVLTRRFISKREPPISLKEYLFRLHQYCPMSTAVYLATSVYITKMSAVEGLIVLGPRNVHRLVLAGLRVAAKALEDLNHSHRRFARVGGVSERELSRLEVSFCFLADFELRVDAQMLATEARSIQSNIGAAEGNRAI